MKQTIYFLIILFTTGILLYLPSLTIPFFSDEIYFIQRNESATFNEFSSLFDKKDYDGYYYRPIGNAVSSVLTVAFSYNPFYYRSFNLLLHILNSFLVYFFVFTLLKTKKNKEIISLFASLFFISFPLHDYAVVWHTDLFDRLLFTFYISSVILFIKKYRITPTSLLLFLLAFLSKESAVSLPLIIFTSHFVLAERYKLYPAFLKALPYVLIASAVILFRLFFLNDNVFKAEDAHSAANIFTILKNLLLFSGMTLFPFYLREIQAFLILHPYTLFAFILFIYPLYKLIKNKKIDSLYIFLILFFIISLLPASRLLMRWYLYLPSIGFFSALAFFIFNFNYKSKLLPIIISIVIVIIYSFTSFIKLIEWNNITNEGHEIIRTFVEENKDVIVESDEIHFLTLPAKIGDIPVFQLAFGNHLNFYLDEKKEVKVLSKSYLQSFSDSVLTEIINGDYLITNFYDNYFIVFDKEKLTFFEQPDNSDYKQEQIIIPINKERNVATFSFSKGSFYHIPGKLYENNN